MHATTQATFVCSYPVLWGAPRPKEVPRHRFTIQADANRLVTICVLVALCTASSWRHQRGLQISLLKSSNKVKYTHFCCMQTPNNQVRVTKVGHFWVSNCSIQQDPSALTHPEIDSPQQDSAPQNKRTRAEIGVTAHSHTGHRKGFVCVCVCVKNVKQYTMYLRG